MTRSDDDLPPEAQSDRGTLHPFVTVAMVLGVIIALLVVFALYNDPWLR
jgi:hypothetical protein